MSFLKADEFLMRSLLTATEAAAVLGVKDSRAARDTLRRWGVTPVGRGAGRNGENRYPAGLVWHRLQGRPGRGWRKGRSRAASTAQDEDTMQSTAEIQSGSFNFFSMMLAGDHPWYVDHDDVVGLASVLVDADWLCTPHEVVEFFAAPWKWDDMFRIWVDAGRPYPPSSDDLAQASQLGRGTIRQELERRYEDDTARWESLIAALDGSGAGVELNADEPSSDGHVVAKVIPLKNVAAPPD